MYDDFELNNMNGRVCGGNVANGWIAGASKKYYIYYKFMWYIEYVGKLGNYS